MLIGSIVAQHRELPSRVSLTLLVTTEIEGREAVVADGQLLGGRVCGRLQDGNTVVLLNVLSANSPIQRPVLNSPVLYPSSRICGAIQRNQTRALLPAELYQKGLGSSLPELNTNARLTFNMCSSVVLPALSRPRNRSLACLLRRPSEAKTS